MRASAEPAVHSPSQPTASHTASSLRPQPTPSLVTQQAQLETSSPSLLPLSVSRFLTLLVRSRLHAVVPAQRLHHLAKSSTAVGQVCISRFPPQLLQTARAFRSQVPQQLWEQAASPSPTPASSHSSSSAVALLRRVPSPSLRRRRPSTARRLVLTSRTPRAHSPSVRPLAVRSRLLAAVPVPPRFPLASLSMAQVREQCSQSQPLQ